MGTTPAQQYCLRWNNHRSNLLNVFDELLRDEAFTDVTLACDDGPPIKCHKMVLAACSPYFQNLFTDLPCKHPIIVLKDVKYCEIKAILEYMYRGEVNVAQDQLAALLKIAETLKVKGLVEENRCSESRKQEEHSSMNCNLQLAHSSSNSPPHSTQYASERGMNLPIWAVPGLPLHPSTVPLSNPTTPTILPNSYDTPLKKKKLSNILINRDTPILRTVLGQGQIDSSHPVSLVCHPDNRDLQGTTVHKREPSEDAQSPYTDPMIMEDDDKSKMAIPSPSPQSDVRSTSSGFTNYVNMLYPENKRYKKYTRDEIMAAIDAVRCGMSALQAAKKYKVPSRTLYDKVKKMGIQTTRPFRKGPNGCFSYGMRGTGSPYGGHSSESEEVPALLLQHALDSNRGDEREALAALAATAAIHGRTLTSPNYRSPSPTLMRYRNNTPTGSCETNGSLEKEEDQVEDLSVSRKPQESGVIMPPMNQVSTITKNEEVLKETLREETQ